jgi:hypothetical protein
LVATTVLVQIVASTFEDPDAGGVEVERIVKKPQFNKFDIYSLITLISLSQSLSWF